ncbi:helix-turn-helix transcriptional regulator [Streptomyces sp. NPDC040750]|uniref:helix-turn-helix domain-containing protein n=1 Tax=Streptomyces sp. NPDC040750 TaxID=3154491 RepID=UPI003401A9F5
MTQKELAEASGVPLTTVNGWATGKAAPRDLEQLAKVGHTLAGWAGELPLAPRAWSRLMAIDRARPQETAGDDSALEQLVEGVNQPIMVFLANFEVYLEHVGDIRAQLDLIPQGMWPIIDTIAYHKADEFLELSGLGDVQPLPEAGRPLDIREALAFLLKVAWERGYFMTHFHRLACIPRPRHRVNHMEIMDEICGGPLVAGIEVTLQRAASLSTEPRPTMKSLRIIDEKLARIVQPHLDQWCDTMRTVFGYGILAAKAEVKVNSDDSLPPED